ncbi:MAG: hypothetical protein U5L95_05220 [Candidatus Saccharibacteria bacterium]|nr:hypothetical protein [Candidatus Saccharibacteria bacterium]
MSLLEAEKQPLMEMPDYGISGETLEHTPRDVSPYASLESAQLNFRELLKRRGPEAHTDLENKDQTIAEFQYNLSLYACELYEHFTSFGASQTEAVKGAGRFIDDMTKPVAASVVKSYADVENPDDQLRSASNQLKEAYDTQVHFGRPKELREGNEVGSITIPDSCVKLFIHEAAEYGVLSMWRDIPEAITMAQEEAKSQNASSQEVETDQPKYEPRAGFLPRLLGRFAL